MWDVITQIGSPIALVAFIVAVVAVVFRERQRNEIRTLERLPEKDRIKKLEALNIPIQNLSREQRFELAKDKLRQRSEFAKIIAVTSIVISIILALLIAYLGSPVGPGPNITSSPETSVSASVTPNASVTETSGTSTSMNITSTPDETETLEGSNAMSITPNPTNTTHPQSPTATFDPALSRLTFTPPPPTPEPEQTRIQQTVEAIVVATRVAEIMKEMSNRSN